VASGVVLSSIELESTVLTTELTQEHYVTECDSVDCRFVNFRKIEKEAVLTRVLFESKIVNIYVTIRVVFNDLCVTINNFTLKIAMLPHVGKLKGKNLQHQNFQRPEITSNNKPHSSKMQF
jgi:hypothetical protein